MKENPSLFLLKLSNYNLFLCLVKSCINLASFLHDNWRIHFWFTVTNLYRYLFLGLCKVWIDNFQLININLVSDVSTLYPGLTPAPGVSPQKETPPIPWECTETSPPGGVSLCGTSGTEAPRARPPPASN